MKVFMIILIILVGLMAAKIQWFGWKAKHGKDYRQMRKIVIVPSRRATSIKLASKHNMQILTDEQTNQKTKANNNNRLYFQTNSYSDANFGKIGPLMT